MEARISESQLVEVVTDALKEMGKPPREPVTADTTLDSLDLNSLPLTEIFMAIEDFVGRELDPDRLEGLSTVGDLMVLTEPSGPRSISLQEAALNRGRPRAGGRESA